MGLPRIRDVLAIAGWRCRPPSLGPLESKQEPEAGMTERAVGLQFSER